VVLVDRHVAGRRSIALATEDIRARRSTVIKEVGEHENVLPMGQQRSAQLGGHGDRADLDARPIGSKPQLEARLFQLT
jgi:hypothetical protein